MATNNPATASSDASPTAAYLAAKASQALADAAAAQIPATPQLDADGNPIITLTVFKCRIPSCTYVMHNGDVIAFVNGIYRTSKQNEIDEITAEIKAGHPHMQIPDNVAEQTVQSDQLDPIANLRASIIADFLKTQAAATNPNNVMGNYQAPQIVATGTGAIAEAAAGSSSTAG